MKRTDDRMPNLPSLPGRTSAFSVAAGAMLLLSILMQVGIRPPWQMQFPELPTAEIALGGVPLTVDVAVSPAARARGLGYRPGLQEGAGMLFIDDQAQPQRFWMKGMRFCLDIIWIDGQQVVGAAENFCPDPLGTPDTERQTASSPVPVRYVVEVPAGWMAENGVTTGSPVTGIEEAAAEYAGE
jgi:uncharacterized membrane protein (UPF0127 family)